MTPHDPSTPSRPGLDLGYDLLEFDDDAELAATIATPPTSGPGLNYTVEACHSLAGSLDDAVLVRALTIFRMLKPGSPVPEADLAQALELPVTQLWGSITNPLKRRADELGLPLPYSVVSRGQEPAYWEDLGGVSARMLQAITREIEARLGGRSASPSGPAEHSPDERAGEPSDGNRYAPLGDHLDQHGARREVTVALEEVERLLGFELPPKAWVDPTWWTESPNLAYRRHISTWLERGWEAYPSLASQRVSFRRARAPQPDDEAPRADTDADAVATPEPTEAPETRATPPADISPIGTLKIASSSDAERSAETPPEPSADQVDPETETDRAVDLPTPPDATTPPTERENPPEQRQRDTSNESASTDDTDPLPPDASGGESSGGRWKIGRFTRSLFLSEKNERPVDCGDYTPHVCAAFAAGLGTGVLERAVTLFDALQGDGRIDSPELAERLGCKTSGLGGRLATPLRRRASAVDIEPPYEIEVDEEEGRRTWRAANGADAYLAGALRDELARRSPDTAT